MSGGGSKTTGTTIQTQQLPSSVQGGLDKAIGGAQSLYDSGSLFKPYAGSTVVPFSEVTEGAIRSASDTAAGSRPAFQQMFNNISAIGNSDGLNDGQRLAMQRLGAVASGQDSTGSNAESNLASFASGAYLDGSNNPWFRDVVNQGVDAARDSVNMSASGMGRTGSGVHQGVLAKETGDLASRMYAGQYNNEVANMFNANSAMDQQRLANIGNRMSAAGDMFNGYQQGQSNAAQARSALPGAYQSLQGLNDVGFAAGSMYEDLAARQMNDSLRLYNEQQQQPMKAVEWLNSISSGQGQLTGGTTQTTQAPRTSPFMAGLGGAATGFGVGGPIGAAIGGGAGLLGSLF